MPSIFKRRTSTSPQTTEVTPSQPEHTPTPAPHHQPGGRNGRFVTPKARQPLYVAPPHELQPTPVDDGNEYGTARPGAGRGARQPLYDVPPHHLEPMSVNDGKQYGTARPGAAALCQGTEHEAEDALSHHLQPLPVDDAEEHGTARPGAHPGDRSRLGSTAQHEAEDDSHLHLSRSSMRELRLDLQQRRRSSREQAPERDALTVPLRNSQADAPCHEEGMPLMPPFTSEFDTEADAYPGSAAETGRCIPPQDRHQLGQRRAAYLQQARFSPSRQQGARATAAALPSQQSQPQAQPLETLDQQRLSAAGRPRHLQILLDPTLPRPRQLQTLPRTVQRQPLGAKGIKRRDCGAAAAGLPKPLQHSNDGFELKTPPKRLSGLQRMGCGAEASGASHKFSEFFLQTQIVNINHRSTHTASP